jgi:hypothetical protein
VNYALTHNLAMFVNYRYLYVDMEDFQATPKLHVDGEDVQKHTASLGLRYAFAPPPQSRLSPRRHRRSRLLRSSASSWCSSASTSRC